MATEWYLLPADTLVSTAQTLSGDVGTPGTDANYGFWNNRGGTGAPTITGLHFVAIAQATDPTSGADIWVSRGVPVLDDYEIEARIVGGLSKTGVLSTDWVPLGRNRALFAPDLANDEGVEIEWRVNAASDSASSGVRVALRPISSYSVPTAGGLVDSGLGGVLSGLGDSGSRYLVSFGGVTENSAAPDDYVELSDLVWIGGGRSRALLTHKIQITGVDGDSSALAAGESYICALTAADDGTITQTKGSKSASTPAKPSLPLGEEPLAWVTREFDGIINDVDIEQIWEVGLIPLSTTTGSLSVQLGKGMALVADSVIHRTGYDTLVLSASSTSVIWLLSDGTPSVQTDGSRPQQRAEAVYEIVTDLTEVTSIKDLRRIVGGHQDTVTIEIKRSGGLQVGDEGFAVWPHPVRGELRPVSPVVLALHDVGSGLSGGSLKVDVGVLDGTDAFSSFYPDSGTDDRRPEVAYNATSQVDRDSLPTVRSVSRWTRLRAVVVTPLPTGTTPPAGVTVSIPLELAGDNK